MKAPTPTPEQAAAEKAEWQQRIATRRAAGQCTVCARPASQCKVREAMMAIKRP